MSQLFAGGATARAARPSPQLAHATDQSTPAGTLTVSACGNAVPQASQSRSKAAPSTSGHRDQAIKLLIVALFADVLLNGRYSGHVTSDLRIVCRSHRSAGQSIDGPARLTKETQTTHGGYARLEEFMGTHRLLRPVRPRRLWTGPITAISAMRQRPEGVSDVLVSRRLFRRQHLRASVFGPGDQDRSAISDTRHIKLRGCGLSWPLQCPSPLPFLYYYALDCV